MTEGRGWHEGSSPRNPPSDHDIYFIEAVFALRATGLANEEILSMFPFSRDSFAGGPAQWLERAFGRAQFSPIFGTFADQQDECSAAGTSVVLSGRRQRVPLRSEPNCDRRRDVSGWRA